MTREYKFFVTDAFTDRSFVGNPSGIVLIEGNMSDEEMQKAARELKHSETAFVRPLDRDIYDIRYFTPTEEVKLSGHGALSTFWTLAEQGYISNRKSKVTVVQHTKAGQLHAGIEFERDKLKFVNVELPVINSINMIDDVGKVSQAFSIDRDSIGIDEDMAPAVIDNGISTMVIPVKNRDMLFAINPKRRRMEVLAKKYGCVAFHLFYYDSGKGVTEQRNFSPTIGVWEESGTGTGSGAMYHYLKVNEKLAAEKLIARQGKGVERPSEIVVSGKNGSVYIGGRACIVMEGILRI